MDFQLLKLTIASLLAIAIGDSLPSAVALPPIARTTSHIPLLTDKQGGKGLCDVEISVLLTVSKLQLDANPQEIARQITVRIITNPGTGSGVIISRNGQTYTVLTNDHVVSDTWDSQYKVLTSDGLTHLAKRINSPKFANLDLAIVQFTSIQDYRVAEVGNSNALLLGQPVYASGFPNWYWANSNTPESTLNWGLKAFKVTTGTLGMLPNSSLSLGYQMGYTNDVQNGMSGGPVLDAEGHLIGINGRLKHPFNGIDAYVFADGSKPSEEEFVQMQVLSWAIPITTFLQLNSLTLGTE